MRILTVAKMKELESQADAHGVTYAMMMTRAGCGVGNLITRKFPGGGRALALIGSGNNGGDALVALRFLAEKGWQVAAYLVRPRNHNDPLIQSVAEVGGIIHDGQKDQELTVLGQVLDQATVWIDGVFGTGIQLPLKSDVSQVLGFIQKYRPRRYVVSVDCPSGVDCDSGEMAPETLAADMTVCMEAIKTGLLKLPAFGSVGELQVVNLELPQEIQAIPAGEPQMTTIDDVARLISPRALDAHKGTFGTTYIAAGSINFTGAPWLAASAAYRSGAGLVTLAVPGGLHAALSGSLPEVTWLILPDEMGVIAAEGVSTLLPELKKASALLLGPGWGQEEPTARFLSGLLGVHLHSGRSGMGFLKTESGGEKSENQLPPLILDADALKLLLKIPRWFEYLPPDTILTPHPGEMSILTGLSVVEIQADRWEIARKYARDWKCVVVLKGALSIIASPDGRISIIPVATPALARAGTGDVLAGLISGLRAQGMAAFDAAVAGAWIHAEAGLEAERNHGQAATVLARDVLETIRMILYRIYEYKKAGA